MPRAAAAGPSTESDLVRAIGLRSAILLVIGSVVGTGIFLTTGTMAVQIPSASLLLLAWTLGGLVSLAGGLTYAEMGAMFPRSGGVYVFLREGYGPLPAFLYGWAAMLVVLSGGIAAVAVGFAEYLSYFIAPLSSRNVLWTVETGVGVLSLSAGQLVAVASILALGAINYVGVRSGNLVNVVLTAAKMGGLAALPLIALVAARVTPAFQPVIPADLPRPAASFGVAMIAVLWTYEAWYFITYAAGEIVEPQRNIPRALVGGILAITGVYVVVNAAYLFALPMDEMRGVVRIGEQAATAMVGAWGATFVALTVVVSALGCNVAALLAGPRLLFAMAADGVFLPAAGRVHPVYRTPHVAIVALTLWSALLALSGTYEQLFTYVMFASILFSVATGTALFRLRRTRPDVPRPYRTWGYPVVPLIFIGASLAFVVNTLLERPVESLIGLGLVALGLPVYWYWKLR
ncbi:MAG TPA: amino acid permease [Vicinamibacterales bacterium]|nr:amino acid permease [Vicinamibacterales bacterium]